MFLFIGIETHDKRVHFVEMSQTDEELIRNIGYIKLDFKEMGFEDVVRFILFDTGSSGRAILTCFPRRTSFFQIQLEL